MNDLLLLADEMSGGNLEIKDDTARYMTYKDDKSEFTYDEDCYRLGKAIGGPMLIWKGTKIPNRVTGYGVKIKIAEDTNFDFKVTDIFTLDEIYTFGLYTCHPKYATDRMFEDWRALAYAGDYADYRFGEAHGTTLVMTENVSNSNLFESTYVNGIRIPSYLKQIEMAEGINSYKSLDLTLDDIFSKTILFDKNRVRDWNPSFIVKERKLTNVFNWVPELLNGLLKGSKDKAVLVGFPAEDLSHGLMRYKNPLDMFIETEVGYKLATLQGKELKHIEKTNREYHVPVYCTTISERVFFFVGYDALEEFIYIANLYKDIIDTIALKEFDTDVTCDMYLPDVKIINKPVTWAKNIGCAH